MEVLLTIEDVMRIFQFKRSYIYHLTHSGQIPHIKIGQHLRFRQPELERWLAQRTHGDTLMLREEAAEYHARV